MPSSGTSNDTRGSRGSRRPHNNYAREPGRARLAGRAWHQRFGRGDGFFDWDMNSFHFVGGVSKYGMHAYRNRFMDHYVNELLGIRVPSELLDVMEAEEARGEWADILA